MSGVPDSALITNLFYGRYKPRIVGMAMELDIFSEMANGVQDIPTLARRCHCHPEGLRLLLNFLTSMGLVQREKDGYTLSATGEFYFVPGRRSYVREWITSEADPQIWEGILRAVQEGIPANTALPFASEAWMSIYVEGQLADILDTWKNLGLMTNRLSSARILDLASGCGIKTLALALTDPGIQVTLVDSAEVLTAAQFVIERFNLSGQTKLIAGDALRTPFENDAYEIVFVGQITYYWTESQNITLFKRLYNVITGGGALIVEATMPDNQDAEQVSMFDFLLWADVGTSLYSYERYHQWIAEAGFTNIRRYGEMLIIAEKN